MTAETSFEDMSDEELSVTETRSMRVARTTWDDVGAICKRLGNEPGQRRNDILVRALEEWILEHGNREEKARLRKEKKNALERQARQISGLKSQHWHDDD